MNIFSKIKRPRILIAATVCTLVTVGVVATIWATNQPKDSQEDSSHKHQYVEVEEIAPTCTSAGSIKYECSDCESEYTETIKPLGHTEGDWEITKEPTSTEEGTRVKKCTRCGEVLVTETIELREDIKEDIKSPSAEVPLEVNEITNEDVVAVPHEHKYNVIDEKASTCTTAGYKIYSCECGANYREVLELKEHNIVTNTKESSCTENGIITYTCQDCGNIVKTEVIKAPGHDWKETIIKEASCTEDGKVKLTCKTCKHEEEKIISALGHSWNLKEHKEVSCENDGYDKYECSRCHEEIVKNYVKAIGHDWIESYREEATNDVDGKIVYTCNNCNNTKEEIIPAPHHKFEVTDEKAPTCTDAGYKKYQCKDCDVSYVENLPALGHDTHEERIEPTCSTEGYIYDVCDRCGDKVEKEIIPKLEHNWEVKDKVEPTCTKNGIYYYECTLCGKEKSEEISALGHDYNTEVINPTCTEDGYTIYTCNRCNLSHTDDKVDALGHDYKVTDSKDASCTEGGYTVYTCERCSDSYTESIPAHGHSYTENVIEPTCIDKGYTEYVCKYCNDTIVNNYTDALGHDISDWTIMIKPDCESEGLEQKICNRCGEVMESRSIEAIGHNWIEKENIAPTCEEDGHITSICENCKKENTQTIPAIGHNWQKVDVVNPTCEEKGYTNYICTNDENHTKKDDYVDALGHKETDWKVVKEPTCTTPGLKEKYCETCNKLLASESIQPVEHDYQITATVAATCEADGHYTYTCTKCNDSYDETIPALGHDYTLSEHKDASCEEEGYDRYSCTRCEKHYDEIIPALEHQYVQSGSTDATCTGEGEIKYTCSICGNETVEVIPALGHDYVLLSDNGHLKIYKCSRCADIKDEVYGDEHNYVETNRTEPTCTAEGKIVYKCEDCGDIYEETLPKLPHVETTVTTKQPTCAEEGEKQIKCSVCGENLRTETIPKLAHIETSAVTKEPTCTENGEKTISCSTCGEVLSTESIPALGHDYTVTESTASTCVTAGHKTYTCNRCGDTYKEDLPLGEHSYKLTTTEMPTCIKEGKKVYTCEYCNDSYEEAIPVIEHSYKTQVIEGTCVDKEKILYTCEVCGDSYTEETENYGDHLYIVTEQESATCESEGHIVHTCKYCKDSYTEKIPATGHDYQITKSEPTCTKSGREISTCTKCGDSNIKVIPALGHEGEWKTIKEPTDTEPGERQKICIRCGQIMSSQSMLPGSNNIQEYTVNTENGTAVVKGFFNDSYANEVINILNEYRTSLGLKELKTSNALTRAAKTRGYEQGYLYSHTRPDGSDCFTVSPLVSAENIAKGYNTAESVMTGWKNSPGHNKNMTNSSYTRVGVSCFIAVDETENGQLTYTYYWVQLFGR